MLANLRQQYIIPTKNRMTKIIQRHIHFSLYQSLSKGRAA